MPKNGYWIECIPLDEAPDANGTRKHLETHLYSASTSSFPDITETASSPDQAIEKLSDRLKTIRQHYQTTGKILPEMDNPVRPPKRLRAVQGWISVYIDLGISQRSMLVHSLVTMTLLGAV